MAFFNKNNKVNNQPKPEPMNEGYATSGGVNLYNFIQGIRQLDSNYSNNSNLIERMTQDSIISSAIDMWTEDSLQKDPQTKEIFNVEVDSPKDKAEIELSKGLSKELNSFLKDSLRMEKKLIPIIKNILIYGSCLVKLDFADTLADEKLELKETNLGTYKSITAKLDNLFNEGNDPSNRLENLNESELEVDLEKYGNDFVNINECNYFKQLSDNKLNESAVLNEEQLTNLKNMMAGRWYTEIFGNGLDIYELTAKEKVVAYLDRNNCNKYINPDRFVNFSNNTGKHKINFEIGDIDKTIENKKYYQLERGESFLENSMVAWQVLSALEDILLLTRMTRSILYRIFSVEVGNKGNKETRDLLDRLKNKIKSDETVDIRSKIYNSSLSQVPLGDSIFIPTRNGVGVIKVDTVGGDVNLKDAIDLDYFRDKLFAGLRIPAPFLGFTESLPGGIGDTSLTRMDIRYSRTITRIQAILSEGLKDLCLLYLRLTRTEKAFRSLPNFKIVFTSINSAEDISRADLKKTQMDILAQVLESLNKLGVDIAGNSEGYENTRQMLIKEYFGSVILESILKDEEAMPTQSPTEGNPKELGGLSNASDLDRGKPGGIISGPSLETNEEEPNEEENNIETTEEPNIEEPNEEEPRELG